MNTNIKVVLDYTSNEVKIFDARLYDYEVLFEASWQFHVFNFTFFNEERSEHIFTSPDLKHFIVKLNEKTTLKLDEDFILSYVNGVDNFITLLFDLLSNLSKTLSADEIKDILNDTCVETIIYILIDFRFELEPSLAHAV